MKRRSPLFARSKPDSLLRRYLGDRRFVLALPRAISLQVLHPAIAAALVEHAPERLWEHKKRTVSSMVHIAYSQRDLRLVIRFGHENVKGIDDLGERFHALNPELFLFQHATYVDTLFTAISTFIRPLSADDREELFADCRDWYRRYGISARSQPATWPAFVEYFTDACNTQLRPSAHSAILESQVLRPDSWLPSVLPEFAVRSLLHDRAAELFDVHPSTADKVAFRTYATAVRAGMLLAPRSAKYLPGARLAAKNDQTYMDTTATADAGDGRRPTVR